MIAHKGKFYGGTASLAAFIAVLIIIFLPVFNGQNGLNYLDALYNSISKGSAYYISEIKADARAFNGNLIRVVLPMTDNQQAQQTAALFTAGGVRGRCPGGRTRSVRRYGQHPGKLPG